MIRIFLSILLMMLPASAAWSNELYIKTFGDSTRPALIFLHGGPGYNSAAFEATTPQRLADSGFFVIVYDRRGEGRSKDTAAGFTFAESSSDLLGICNRYGLAKATLLGHSFGGVIGTKFTIANPERVRALVLIGAPIDLQESFRNIIARCRTIYQSKGDSGKLSSLTILEKSDTASLMYSTYCFGHAMQNGFYTPANRSPEAKLLFQKFRADSVRSRQASQMDFKAPKGYWESEHYTTIDLRPDIQAILRKRVPVYGMYGKEDGLYSAAQVAGLEKMLGRDKVLYLENCSHNVFIDQQDIFTNALIRWIR